MAIATFANVGKPFATGGCRSQLGKMAIATHLSLEVSPFDKCCRSHLDKMAIATLFPNT